MHCMKFCTFKADKTSSLTFQKLTQVLKYKFLQRKAKFSKVQHAVKLHISNAELHVLQFVPLVSRHREKSSPEFFLLFANNFSSSLTIYHFYPNMWRPKTDSSFPLDFFFTFTTQMHNSLFSMLQLKNKYFQWAKTLFLQNEYLWFILFFRANLAFLEKIFEQLSCIFASIAKFFRIHFEGASCRFQKTYF